MPTYEYSCTDCGCKFEVFASMKAKEEGLAPVCPTCGSAQTVAAVSPVAIGKGDRARPSGCCGGTNCCSPQRN